MLKSMLLKTFVLSFCCALPFTEVYGMEEEIERHSASGKVNIGSFKKTFIDDVKNPMYFRIKSGCNEDLNLLLRYDFVYGSVTLNEESIRSVGFELPSHGEVVLRKNDFPEASDKMGEHLKIAFDSIAMETLGSSKNKSKVIQREKYYGSCLHGTITITPYVSPDGLYAYRIENP